MDARYALDLRIAAGRPLMIKQFVVLKREREIAPARMANDVNSCTDCTIGKVLARGIGSMPITASCSRNMLAS